jgi:hypothetical protein
MCTDEWKTESERKAAADEAERALQAIETAIAQQTATPTDGRKPLPSHDVIAPAEPEILGSDDAVLARVLVEHLKTGKPLTAKSLQDAAGVAYGGTLAEGKFDRKDMYDALELAINMMIKDDWRLQIPGYRTNNGDPMKVIHRLDELVSRLPRAAVRPVVAHPAPTEFLRNGRFAARRGADRPTARGMILLVCQNHSSFAP